MVSVPVGSNSGQYPFGTARFFADVANRSVKFDSYFAIYDALLAKYRHKSTVLVEIGVLNGGSLQLWRRFLGPQARIIGIDLDPAAIAMRGQNFEIHIGDQSSPAFWGKFFDEVGDVDVIIDDGGHTNRCQITTVDCCIPHVRDGGLILVEDTHTSYLPEFGNPSRYSFMNYAKRLADKLQNDGRIYSVQFYKSMVAIYLDRRLCKPSELVRAGNQGIGAVNQWNADKRVVGFATGRTLRELLPVSIADALARLMGMVARGRFVLENYRLRRFFR